MLTDHITPERLKMALNLRKKGVSDADLYKTLWPKGGAPLPLDAFAAIMAAESLADEISLPTVELSGDAREVQQVLAQQRAIALESLTDEEGRPNVMMHQVLVRNAEATIKLLKYRIDAETHEINRQELERERRPKGVEIKACVMVLAFNQAKETCPPKWQLSPLGTLDSDSRKWDSQGA